MRYAMKSAERDSKADEAGMLCRVCGDEGPHRVFNAEEKMYGLGHRFEYFQCGSCGCLQIAVYPANIGDYYPGDYYSYNMKRPEIRVSRNAFNAMLRRTRNRWLVEHRGWVGRVLAGVFPYTELPLPEFMIRLGIPLDAAVLDIGCGNGKLLCELANYGYSRLTGLDPFITNDLEYKNGVRVVKMPLGSFRGNYDFVMMNHSLEHMPEQNEVLSHVYRMTADAGTVLVRIPTVSSWAWEHYGLDWVALDAPRHLYLHSRESITKLAEKSGFFVHEIVCDSIDFQCWGSEQYRRGIPLCSERSRWQNEGPGVFAEEELETFRLKTDKLNAAGRGDCIQVVLKKKPRKEV